MLLWQSSSAPASWNSRLPASMHTRPGNCGRLQVLGPNGESPFAPNRPRACVSHVGEHDAGPLRKTRA